MSFFLDDDRADFAQWDRQLPFEQKMDAILANFAVINNIADIESLFKALSLVIKPKAHCIALILNGSFKRGTGSRAFGRIRSFFPRKPFSFHIQHNESRQTVFIYTIREIRKASAPYFDFFNDEPLYQSGFSLIHLVRK